MLGGFITPGSALAVNMFKAYGTLTLAQAIGFLDLLKIGHYMKIPPRVMFRAQILPTFISCAIVPPTQTDAANVVPHCDELATRQHQRHLPSRSAPKVYLRRPRYIFHLVINLGNCWTKTSIRTHWPLQRLIVRLPCRRYRTNTDISPEPVEISRATTHLHSHPLSRGFRLGAVQSFVVYPFSVSRVYLSGIHAPKAL
jgi:hypothetical protein